MKDEFSNGSDLMKKNMDEEDLASLVIQQIEFCNIILLNKAAEVEPKDLEHLKQIIRAIQPKAEIFECNYGDVDLNLIVNTKKFDWETVATSAGWIQEFQLSCLLMSGTDNGNEKSQHHTDTKGQQGNQNGCFQTFQPPRGCAVIHKVALKPCL